LTVSNLSVLRKVMHQVTGLLVNKFFIFHVHTKGTPISDT